MTKSAEPDTVDVRLQLPDHAGGEALIDEAAVARVQRRVHRHHHQPLLFELVLGRLPQERALAIGGKALRVTVHRDAVLVAGDGPEPGTVGLLVPVRRGVAAQVGEPLVGHTGDEVAGVGQIDRCGIHHDGTSMESDTASD
jgi:hypothetical protein